MDRKLVLTSIVALSFAMPAIADFPQDGLMKENQVYTGAAIHANMGVYEGTVYANAVYEAAAYNVLPGTYLPQNSSTVTDCLSGYYCPGLADPVGFSATNDQGLVQCPDGYRAGSDANASQKTQCYKACNVADFPHATVVSGNDFYGFATQDTCMVDSCAAGWIPRGPSVDNYVAANLNQYMGHGGASGYAYINDNGSFVGSYNSEVLFEPANSGSADSGSSFVNSGAVDSSAVYHDMFVQGELGGWGVIYPEGNIRGMARLSTVDGTSASATVNSASDVHETPPTLRTTEELGEEGGTHCYCSITGVWFKDAGYWKVATSKWAYAGAVTSLGNCAKECKNLVGGTTYADLAFVHALFNTVTGYNPAGCTPNTITINWGGTTAAEINANQAGTAMYGGDVRTPRSATPVPGKIFMGWEFTSSPNQN